MKIFIVKSFLFFFIIILAIILLNVFVGKSIEPSNYMSAIIDKHERNNKIKTPKIILAGGSNVAFGINSEKIEEAFSVPVVNMGLHAGLGLSFMLEELKFSIKEGDLVLINPEYFLENDGDYKLKQNAGDYYKDANLFYTRHIYDGLNIYLENTLAKYKNLFSPAEISLTETQKKVYSREAFNKYGDAVAHLGIQKPGKINGRVLFNYKFWEGIKAINEFAVYAEKNNVKVFYMFPDFPSSEYIKNQNAIMHLQSDLKNNLKIEILNTPTDFLYADSLFYDTIYHLTATARDDRTNKMIDLIKKNKIAQQRISEMSSTVDKLKTRKF